MAGTVMSGFINAVPEDLLVRRKRPREEDHRGYYFRDTTAIIHSYPFRRLKHKTQVFFSPKNDHICTRIEHVMHVATISTTICKALGLDTELSWAIGLGHDLGHAPFGHTGENILDGLVGGFCHELYTLRVVDRLVHYGRGLNLTHAVRDGVMKHCGERFEQTIRPNPEVQRLEEIETLGDYPCTWEGVVVRMSDIIAYLGRDLEDAIQLGVIGRDEIPGIAATRLGRSNAKIIDALVNDVVATSDPARGISFSDESFRCILALKDFNYKRIYLSEVMTRYQQYFERILKTLFTYLKEIFDRYGFDIDKYLKEGNVLAVRFGDYLKKMHDFYDRIDGSFTHVVTDYLAGMTDDFAIECVRDIMIPQKFETALYFRELLAMDGGIDRTNYLSDKNLPLFDR